MTSDYSTLGFYEVHFSLLHTLIVTLIAICNVCLQFCYVVHNRVY